MHGGEKGTISSQERLIRGKLIFKLDIGWRRRGHKTGVFGVRDAWRESRAKPKKVGNGWRPGNKVIGEVL